MSPEGPSSVLPRSSPRDEFARLAALPDGEIDLAEAALWIAAEEYPRLDVAGYLEKLDALSERLAPDWPRDADLARRVQRLNRFLFAEQGLRGNTSHFYDPRNSYLNEVIDRKLGIPITLCILYIAVGRRLGLDVRGETHVAADAKAFADRVVSSLRAADPPELGNRARAKVVCDYGWDPSLDRLTSLFESERAVDN